MRSWVGMRSGRRCGGGGAGGRERERRLSRRLERRWCFEEGAEAILLCCPAGTLLYQAIEAIHPHLSDYQSENQSTLVPQSLRTVAGSFLTIPLLATLSCIVGTASLGASLTT